MNEVPLSITTRGIGLGTCNLGFLAAAAGVPAPLYALYRVYLGLAEAKLNLFYWFGQRQLPLYKCQVHMRKLDAALMASVVPAPMKSIIDAIGTVTHDGTTYCPVVAEAARDGADRLVPRPESLLLSGLREAVEALASPETPPEQRAAFRDNCPIPGAVWDGDLLMNADEIIPEGYDLDESLSRDIYLAGGFIMGMHKEYPSMVNGPLSSGQAAVGTAALVSNEMGTLRAEPRGAETLEEYCKRCLFRGEQGLYHQRAGMCEADVLAGQVALLGEWPGQAAVAAPELTPLLPVYAARAIQTPYTKCPVEDYIYSIILTNNALLFPATQEVPPGPPQHGRGRGRANRNRRGKPQ